VERKWLIFEWAGGEWVMLGYDNDTGITPFDSYKEADAHVEIEIDNDMYHRDKDDFCIRPIRWPVAVPKAYQKGA